MFRLVRLIPHRVLLAAQCGVRAEAGPLVTHFSRRAPPPALAVVGPAWTRSLGTAAGRRPICIGLGKALAIAGAASVAAGLSLSSTLAASRSAVGVLNDADDGEFDGESSTGQLSQQQQQQQRQQQQQPSQQQPDVIRTKDPFQRPVSESVKDQLPTLVLPTELEVDGLRVTVHFPWWRRAIRLLHLCLIATPMLLTAPLLLLPWDVLHVPFYRAVLWAVQRAGSAFVKLGQWASERDDFLPSRLCHTLGQLREAAPHHDLRQSEAGIRAALAAASAAHGIPMELVWLERQPVASGCVAQVHRGLLRVCIPVGPARDGRHRPLPSDDERGADAAAEAEAVSALWAAPDPGALYADPFTSVLALPMRSGAGASSPAPAAAQAEPRATGATATAAVHASSAARSPSAVAAPAFTVYRELLLPVAVKLRHPDVRRTMLLDLQLGFTLAERLAALPLVRWARLPLLLEEFTQAIAAQLDLAREAVSLSRFRRNFAHRSALHVAFPAPVLATADVLVETWEPGESMQRFLDDPHHADALAGGAPQLARQGFHAFVTMLLRDNWLHADPHAGNLFVRTDGPGARPTLVVLDAGLAVQLRPRGRAAMLSLLRDVLRADGAHAADSILAMAQPEPGAPFDRARFRREMQTLFERHCGQVTFFDPRTGVIRSRTPTGAPLNVGALITDLMMLVREHRVRLEETDFAQVVITVGVLEGIGRQLDPGLDLVPLLAPYLFREARQDAAEQPGAWRAWFRTMFHVVRNSLRLEWEQRRHRNDPDDSGSVDDAAALTPSV